MQNLNYRKQKRKINFFKKKSLSSASIYSQSLIYAKNINYNLENIKYSDFTCSIELPLCFNELVRVHNGYTFYDFFEHRCSSFNEYLRQKDEEYYNYVNGL